MSDAGLTCLRYVNSNANADRDALFASRSVSGSFVKGYENVGLVLLMRRSRVEFVGLVMSQRSVEKEEDGDVDGEVE